MRLVKDKEGVIVTDDEEEWNSIAEDPLVKGSARGEERNVCLQELRPIRTSWTSSRDAKKMAQEAELMPSGRLSATREQIHTGRFQKLFLYQ